MTPSNFAIIIPAYNEALTILAVVESALQQTPNVIVVNDASTDATAEIVRQTPARLVEHPRNQGKAGALLTGMAEAMSLKVDCVITLDGDGQHDPQQLPQLLNAFESYPNHLIIAARLKNRENAPRARRIANKIADFWVGWAASSPIADSQSGFRLYPIELVRNLKTNAANPSGFVFESEVLIDASTAGYGLAFVPIASCYPKERRASHFRPGFDITQITLMVAGKLLRRWMNLPGLAKSLFRKPQVISPSD